MKKLTILLDLDDVLNNQDELWVAELNARHNRSVRLEDITDWDISKFYPGVCKIDLYEPVCSGRFVPQMRPTPGSVDYTYRWYSAGHNLMIATSTSTDNIEMKVKWLYRHFRWFDEKNLIVTHHKQLLRGDILVDDGIHNLLPDKLTGTVPQYVKLCMDRPWNRSFDCLKHGLHRIRSFEEIDCVIQILSRKKG